jgi:hypothetical protein
VPRSPLPTNSHPIIYIQIPRQSASVQKKFFHVNPSTITNKRQSSELREIISNEKLGRI